MAAHGTRTRYVAGCRCTPCTASNRAYNAHRNRQRLYGRWDTGRIDAAPARAHVQALQTAGVGLRRIEALSGVTRNTLQKLLHGVPHRGHAPSRRIHPDTATAILALPLDHTAPADHTPVAATGAVRRLQALIATGWTQTALAQRLGMTVSNFGALLARDQVTADRDRCVRALYDQLWNTPPAPATKAQRGAATRARRHAAARGWPPPMAWDDDTIDDPAAQPGPATSSPVTATERAEEIRWLLRSGESVTETARRIGVSPDLVRRHLQDAA